MSDEFDPWENIDFLRDSVETSLTIVSVIDAREARGELCPDDPAVRARHRNRIEGWRANWSPELQRAVGLRTRRRAS